MSRAAQLRELSRRLVRGLYPNPAKTFNLESPSTVIVKDYQLLSTNYMKPAKIDYHPILCSMEPQYKYPLSSNIHFNAAHVYIAHGSCFPVAPNILLTARHAVYDSRLIDAGYKVSAILSHNPFLSHESLCCRVIPGVSKVEIEEKDPITGQSWIKFLSNDYIFLEVLQPVSHWNTVMLPKAAREGDSIVFPALRPPIENIFDAQLVSDTLFALEEAFIYSGLSEQEAKERVKRLNIDFVTLSKFIGTESTIQGEGKVLRIANGLIAHDSPFTKGMSGTFGSVSAGTFSTLGISTGMGVISAGTNYNVGVDINRDDFKEDYANIVLPLLPHDAKLQAEIFLKG